ncbi:JAB N-terminal domain-containing protein [Streptomyces sp. NPDC021093]|uniref:JAB N-terminal domain-containing protein n=1 Tax=Streptomyces sp. NPDC021093 TaxID=3365112 RepID=UPI00378F4770
MNTPGDIEVELFRTDDYVRAGRLPLLPLLRRVLEPVVGQSLEGTTIELAFLPLTDRASVRGKPSVVNLRGSHGYVQVRIVRRDTVLYRHPHAVRELVGVPLQEILGERLPDETHWGFGLRGPGLEKSPLVRPRPPTDKTMEITVGGPRRRLFGMEEVPEPDPPLITLEELGVAGPHPRTAAEPVSVVLHPRVHRALSDTRPFSREVEEGGFLAGHVHRNGTHPDGHVVEVTDALPAERTGASLLHFTFTGESYLRIGESLAARDDGECLVGWYHTHLFPASDRFGLSSADVDLHTTTFHRPWQVAALVNIDRTSRVVRLYRRDGTDRMTKAPYWVREP